MLHAPRIVSPALFLLVPLTPETITLTEPALNSLPQLLPDPERAQPIQVAIGPAFLEIFGQAETAFGLANRFFVPPIPIASHELEPGLQIIEAVALRHQGVVDVAGRGLGFVLRELRRHRVEILLLRFSVLDQGPAALDVLRRQRNGLLGLFELAAEVDEAAIIRQAIDQASQLLAAQPEFLAIGVGRFESSLRVGGGRAKLAIASFVHGGIVDPLANRIGLLDELVDDSLAVALVQAGHLFIEFAENLTDQTTASSERAAGDELTDAGHVHQIAAPDHVFEPKTEDRVEEQRRDSARDAVKHVVGDLLPVDSPRGNRVLPPLATMQLPTVAGGVADLGPKVHFGSAERVGVVGFLINSVEQIADRLVQGRLAGLVRSVEKDRAVAAPEVQVQILEVPEAAECAASRTS